MRPDVLLRGPPACSPGVLRRGPPLAASGRSLRPGLPCGDIWRVAETWSGLRQPGQDVVWRTPPLRAALARELCSVLLAVGVYRCRVSSFCQSSGDTCVGRDIFWRSSALRAGQVEFSDSCLASKHSLRESLKVCKSLRVSGVLVWPLCSLCAQNPLSFSGWRPSGCLFWVRSSARSRCRRRRRGARRLPEGRRCLPRSPSRSASSAVLAPRRGARPPASEGLAPA